jgi:hypothetical protein
MDGLIMWAALGVLWIVVQKWATKPSNIQVTWNTEYERTQEMARFNSQRNRDLTYIDPTYADFESKPFALDTPRDNA